MKKTKLFSRIFAATLAAVVTATTLITNSGAGLSAFAAGGGGGDPTQSDGKCNVTIVSPDVPSGEGTYRYDFYQIIGGEVEYDSDLGKHVIANPYWGSSMAENEHGGVLYDFDQVIKYTDEEKALSYAADAAATGGGNGGLFESLFDKDCWARGTTSGAGTGYSSAEQALFVALSGSVGWHSSVGSSSDSAFSNIGMELYKQYRDMIGKYNPNNPSTDTGFYAKFIRSNGTGKERSLKGFVELLNEKENTLAGYDLQAMAELLWTGASAKITLLGESPTGQTRTYNYKFVDTAKPVASSAVISKTSANTEYTVQLEPGYYLVACVDAESNKPANETYDSALKPKSFMLLLVGPNEKANTIVGKNTTAVATVDLKMFHETIGLTDIDADKKYGSVTSKMTWDSDGSSSEIFTEDYWLDRTSYGNLKRHIFEVSNNKYQFAGESVYDELVLYRIDVTLPKNFESYEDVGYFLAVLGDWNRGTTSAGICRDTRCRPLVYVKHEGTDPEYICDIGLDNIDDKVIGAFSCASTSNSNLACNPLGNISTYTKNGDIFANETMYLGDLFNKDQYGIGTDDPETTDVDEREIPFKGGDHIYIYFPAYYTNSNVITESDRLIKPAHTWAVYSNNPYSTAKANGGLSRDNGWVYRYVINGHVNSGDVGISPVSETNINTYSLTVHVGGDEEDTNGNKLFEYSNSDYALYRVNDEGEKEYALLYRGRNNGTTLCIGWYTISEIEEYFSGYGSVLEGEGDSVKIASGNHPISTSDFTLNFTLNSTVRDDNNKIVSYSRTINGLSFGIYYIEELSIGLDVQNNIKTYHYEKATQPFKLTIGQEYNPNVTSFVEANMAELINKLSVDFDQLETKDRTISAEILKPVPNDGNTDKNSVVRNLTENEAATDDGIVEVLITHKSMHLIWLPETGGIGTTIFFIIGGTIVVAATVLIVTRFRIKRERL
ncbi:MAG: LPXTG cell wall anchor domain-containing protein [Oscillospiraceae bacterium]|nr:LPXTG cell wall anchor domain-containing protein [Oscillospiraceae bacterium]